MTWVWPAVAACLIGCTTAVTVDRMAVRPGRSASAIFLEDLGSGDWTCAPALAWVDPPLLAQIGRVEVLDTDCLFELIVQAPEDSPESERGVNVEMVASQESEIWRFYRTIWVTITNEDLGQP